MPLQDVTLFSEQRAVLRVDAPAGVSDRGLHRLALDAMDACEGTWEPVFAGLLRGVPAGSEHFWDQVDGLVPVAEMGD